MKRVWNEKYQPWEDYEKNLLCIQDVMDRLLSNMKGHNISFRSEITDKNGAFSHKKLCSLVKRILSLWAEKQRDSTFEDPNTGESLAEPYIKGRWELYGSYLYLVMRCSLFRGTYALVCGLQMEERTDFAFLLEQAKRISRSWCVMKNPDGSKKNELFWGYDDHFGLHLYQVLSSHLHGGFDNLLVRDNDWPVHRPAFLTDEGNVTHMLFKKVYLGRNPMPGKKEAIEQDEDSSAVEEDYENADVTADDHGNGDWEDPEEYEEEAYEESYAPDEDDGWYGGWEETEEDSWVDYEATWKALEKQEELEWLYKTFECSKEYLEACRFFMKKFQEAEPEVVRRFYEDLDEMVSLYLAEQKIPPLMDEDTFTELYSSIYDGPYRQARVCARRIYNKLVLVGETD